MSYFPRPILEASVDQKKAEQDKMRDVERVFPFFVEGSFARMEMQRYLKEGGDEARAESKFGTIEAWRQYAIEGEIDTQRDRLPPNTLKRFMKAHGISLDKQAALMMRLWRARRRGTKPT